VLDEGKTVAAAARALGLTESSLRNWLDQAPRRSHQRQTGLTTEERAELATLQQRQSRVAHGARHPKKNGHAGDRTRAGMKV